MAGSIIVRYAKKTYKQQRQEDSGSHAQMKHRTHSVEIIPESESIMTFQNWEEARKFAQHMNETGHHIIEMKDDYHRS